MSLPRGPWSSRLLGHRGAPVGVLLAVVVLGLALLGPLVTSDPNATDYTNQLASPSGEHWLGTDGAGRDVLSRAVTGTRTSLGAAATVAGLSVLLGLALGGLAGYLRGPVDLAVSRAIDVVLGLPDLIVALAVVGALGVGHRNLVLALVFSGWAPIARVARSLALGSFTRPDVLAARLAGASSLRAFMAHVMPGMLAQVFVVAATRFGAVILSLAGLSFLGLGAQPPTAELGRMLSESQGDLALAPWLGLGPGAMIVVSVAAAMLLSDAISDALDPGTPGEAQPAGLRLSRPGNGARLQRRDDVQRPPDADHMPTPSPALAVRGLSVWYGDGTRALSAVDLDVAPGECVALIGESGCGKTTLARTVLRLLPPAAAIGGEVQVNGVDVTAMTGSQLRRLRGLQVGYVAQDPFAAFDPLRSVRHHVAEAWRAQGLRAPDDLDERVAALGLKDARSRLGERPHQWSGGMLQRATIAAAVAHEPTVVIADEPTSALDAHHAEGVLATLQETSDALLLISHDIGLVQNHADRIVVMRHGCVVEEGRTEDLISTPQDAYTQLLLAASPLLGPVAPAAR